MITAKLRLGISLLLLFCLLLCSCRTSSPDYSALHALKSGQDEMISPEFAFEHDYVVIPENAGSELIAHARTFATALSEQTGIPASLYFDNEEFLMRENARLILIGNVKNALAQAHLRTLKRDDYLCIAEENALILGGKSDAATIAAVKRFSESLLPYADAEILMNADQHFTVRAEYTLSSVTINGFSLEDYRLVYPQNEALGEKSLAYTLREQIADRCGFYLDVLSDNLVDEQVRVIAIGNCFGHTPPSQSAIYTENSVITLYGASNYALCDATRIFLDRLFADAEAGTATLSLVAPIPVSAAAPSLLALGGLLTERDAISNIISISDLSALVQTHAPSMIPVSTVSQHLLTTYLAPSLAGYTCLVPNESAEYTLPFFYRENELTLREQATIGSIHKMLFSIQESETNFTVLHAFAETQADALTVLQAAPSQSEPTLIFLITPTSITLSKKNAGKLCGPFVTEQEELRLQVLMHLPQGFSETTVEAPTSADEPYTFTVFHPFFDQTT